MAPVYGCVSRAAGQFVSQGFAVALLSHGKRGTAQSLVNDHSAAAVSNRNAQHTLSVCMMAVR